MSFIIILLKWAFFTVLLLDIRPIIILCKGNILILNWTFCQDNSTKLPVLLNAFWAFLQQICKFFMLKRKKKHQSGQKLFILLLNGEKGRKEGESQTGSGHLLNTCSCTDRQEDLRWALVELGSKKCQASLLNVGHFHPPLNMNDKKLPKCVSTDGSQMIRSTREEPLDLFTS